VFKLLAHAGAGTGYSESVLYSFGAGGSNDGAFPFASLIADSAGALYGTTTQGGSGCTPSSGGCGTVFKLVP
jgi:hypothetical protein